MKNLNLGPIKKARYVDQMKLTAKFGVKSSEQKGPIAHEICPRQYVRLARVSNECDGPTTHRDPHQSIKLKEIDTLTGSSFCQDNTSGQTLEKTYK